MSLAVRTRNAILGFGYRSAVRPTLFRSDPESVHDRMTVIGQRLGRSGFGRTVTRWAFGYHHPSLAQTVAGIRFSNPIGLSAGFDKEGKLIDILPAVGFGFMEIGSITGQPSPGNQKPRLWRLPKFESIVVNYGLNSSGAQAVAARLRQARPTIPLGLNVAKANIPATDDIDAGVADYCLSFKTLKGIGDYRTINISCPNTSGGEPFAVPANLDRLLTALDRIDDPLPRFLKLPADISLSTIDQLIEICQSHRVMGFTCTNLTKDRSNPLLVGHNVPPKGSLSGRLVSRRADEILAHVFRRTHGRMPLIGVGGVYTADDAYRKIKLGASLVQLITGMIYRGPQLISQISVGLVELLRRDGLTLATAIGKDNT